jgi:molybdopterin molybdotransferase
VAEDVARGAVVVPAGRPLGPFDVGALLGLGILEVEVYKRPVVTVFSTGDEVVEPAQTPPPGKVRDINKYAVAAGVESAGGVPVLLPTVPDDLDALTEAIGRGAKNSDMVILSGGSSVGGMDFTLAAVDACGPPGVLVHGLAVKPGKPTIFGMAGDVPVVGLPGHPSGALVIFTVFIAPLIARIGGNRKAGPFSRSVSAQITRSVAGSPGKHVYVPTAVQLDTAGGLPRAVPILGKSGAISILTKSDGIVVIDPMHEGIEARATVEVYLHKIP